MADMGSRYPISVKDNVTLQIKLKWAKAQEQEFISRINGLNQQIEDKLKRDIPNLEAEVMQLKDKLEQTKLQTQIYEKELSGEVLNIKQQ